MRRSERDETLSTSTSTAARESGVSHNADAARESRRIYLRPGTRAIRVRAAGGGVRRFVVTLLCFVLTFQPSYVLAGSLVAAESSRNTSHARSGNASPMRSVAVAAGGVLNYVTSFFSANDTVDKTSPDSSPAAFDPASAALVPTPTPTPDAAISRHAPSFNGGRIEGNLRVYAGENIAINSTFQLTGDLYTVGTPNIIVNSGASYGGLVDDGGTTTPTGYPLTLNSGFVMPGKIHKRANALTLPTMPTVPAASGTRTVNINTAADVNNIGSWSTVKDLNVSPGGLTINVPPGNYGTFSVNGASRLNFTAGTYNFAGTINLNAGSTVQTTGSVTINIAQNFNLNGGFINGTNTQPGDVLVNIIGTSVNFNNTSSVTGSVRAPNATVGFNGTGVVTGQVIANYLNMNGGKITGNTSVTPPPDTTPPAIAITSPANNSTTTATSINVSGTAADPGTNATGIASVTVNNVAATYTAATGQWTIANVALNLGANTITARATDVAGNATNVSVTVTREQPPDTQPPAVAITSPANNSTTNNSTTNVSGTVSDTGTNASGVSRVMVNGTQATLNGGTWTLSGVALSVGPNTITATAFDNAGNQNSSSIVVNRQQPPDTQLPQVSITSPANNSTTTETLITVTGAASDDGQYQSGIARVTVNGITAVYDSTSRQWTASNVPVALGANNITATAVDNAGNQSTASINVTREEPPDTAPPNLSITSPADGSSTDAESITVSGAVSDSGTNASGVAQVTVNGASAAIDTQAGTWSLAGVALTLGDNTISVRATDHAGNEVVRVVHVTRVRPPDTQPPTLTITSPADGATVPDETITVSGTASDNGDNAAGVRTVTVNGTAATYDAATGHWSASGIALGEGANIITVVATDAAPAANSREARINVTRRTPDRDAPVVTITSPLTSFETYDAAINVAGTATDDGLNATGVQRVTVGGREAAYNSTTKQWSLAGLELAYGENNIVVVATDGASPAHEGQAQVRVTRLRIPPPVLTVSNPRNGSVYSAGTITVGGTVSSISHDPLTVTVNGATAAVSGGSFTKTITLADGANTITVVAADSLEQQTQVSLSILRDQTPPAISFLNVPSTVQPGGSYQIQADASDNVGISEVEFRVNGERAGSDTEAPYQFTLNVPTPLTAGNVITLSAIARDLSGATTVATAQTRTSGPGGVSGYVFDDVTGYVVEGTSAALEGGAVSTNSDADGAYSLVSTTPTGVVRLSKAGYTPVERLYTISSGEGIALFDARLTPTDAHANPLGQSGGAATGDGGRLQVAFGAGALPVDADVRVTSVSPQGLENLLPFGWSPVPGAIVDVRAGAVVSFNAPAHLRVAQTPYPPVGRSLVLAYYDEQAHGWTVVGVGLVAGASGELEADLARPGQYAFLVGDVGATAPPVPASGQSLTSSRAADPASLDAAQATAVSTPRTAAYSADARSTISFVADAPAQLPSGVAIEATLDETYNFLGGKDQLLVGRPAQDFVLYSFPGATSERPNRLGAFFIAKPTRTEFTVAELLNANVHVEIRSGRQPRTGALIGSQGGSLTSANGARLVVPANAVQGQQPIFFGDVAPEQANVTLPEGYEIVGAFDVDLTGATLSHAASISVPSFAGDASRIVVARVLNVGGQRAPKVVARAVVEDGRLVSNTSAPSGVTLSGITSGGRYVFIRVPIAFGYATGRVTDAGTSVALARVSGDRTPFIDMTAADGRFVLVGSAEAPGANQLNAASTATDATGKAAATLAAQDAVAQADIALASVPLAVESVTPTDGAQNAVATTPVTVTFNKPVAPQTVTASNFKLATSGRNPVLGQITVLAGSRVAVFTPSTTLAGSTTYRVTVGQGLRDIYGKPLAAAFSSTFTTASVVTVDARLKPEKIRINYPNGDGISHIVVPSASVPEGSVIIAVNETSGATVSTVAGTAAVEFDISAQVGDQITLIIRQPDGVEYRVSQAAYRRADGYTSIGAHGGTFTSDDGRILVEVPEGAITGQANLQLVPKTEADITAPRTGQMNPTDVPFGAGVEIRASGDFKSEKEVHLEIAVPQGTAVQEGQRVAFMTPTKIDWEDQQINAWESLTTGKVEDGKFKTMSPPYIGVTIPQGVTSGVSASSVVLLSIFVFVPLKLRAVHGIVTQAKPGELSEPVAGVLCVIGEHLAAGQPFITAHTNSTGNYGAFSFIAEASNLQVNARYGSRIMHATASPHFNIEPQMYPGLIGVESFFANIEFPPPADVAPAQLEITAGTGETPHDTLAELGVVSVGKHIGVIVQNFPAVADFKGTVRINGTEGPPLTWEPPQAVGGGQLRKTDFFVSAEGSYSIEIETLTDKSVPASKARKTLNFIALRNPNTRPPLPGPPKVISTTPPDGASQVDAGSAIHLEFSEPVTNLDAGTTVYLLDTETGNKLSGQITSGGIPVMPDSAGVSTVDFAPSGVAGGKQYEIHVTTAVLDSEQKHLDQDYTGEDDTSQKEFTSKFKTFAGIVLTETPVADDGYRIAVAGEYAATIKVNNTSPNGGSTLTVYDVSNPTKPTLTGKAAVPFRAIALAMVEVEENDIPFKVPGTKTEYTRLAFVTTVGLPDGERANNVWIYNLSDPSKPYIVGVTSLSFPVRVTSVPVFITIHQKRAYIGNVASQGVMVIDIEKSLGLWAKAVQVNPVLNAGHPMVKAVSPNVGFGWEAKVQTLMHGPAPTGNPSPANSVSVIQQVLTSPAFANPGQTPGPVSMPVAYVASQSRTQLLSFGVHPSRDSQNGFSDFTPVDGMEDRLLLSATPKNVEPVAPILDVRAVSGAAVRNGRADLAVLLGYSRLWIFNVTNPMQPTQYTSKTFAEMGVDVGYARRLEVEGTLAYVLFPDRVVVFDFSDPEHPAHVATLDQVGNNLSWLAVKDGFVYTLSNGTSAHEGINVSIARPASQVIVYGVNPGDEPGSFCSNPVVIDRATRRMAQPAGVFFQVFGHDLPHAAKVIIRKEQFVGTQHTEQVLATLQANIGNQSNTRVIVGNTSWNGAEVIDPQASYTAELVLDEGEPSELRARREPIPFSTLIAEYQPSFGGRHNGKPPFGYILGAPANVTMTIEGANRFLDAADPHPRSYGLNSDQVLLDLPVGTYNFALRAQLLNNSAVSDEVSGEVIVSDDDEVKVRLPGSMVVNGVELSKGNLGLSSTDISVKNRGLSLNFTRSYNSAASTRFNPLGYGWRHNYQVTLIHDVDGKSYTMEGGDGSSFKFLESKLDGGKIEAEDPHQGTLVKNPDGTFDFFTKEYVKYHFPGAFDLNGTNYFNSSYMGNLEFMEEPNGNRISLSYDTDGRLTRVTDSSDRTLNFTYELAETPFVGVISTALAGNISCTNKKQFRIVRNRFNQADVGKAWRITKIEGPGGLTFTYEYDADGNLAAVTHGGEDQISQTTDDSVWRYAYGPQAPQGAHVSTTHLVKSVSSPNNNAGSHTTNYEYDFGVVRTPIKTINSPEGVTNRFAYTLDSQNRVSQARVTDGRGNDTLYDFDQYEHATRILAPLGAETVMQWNDKGQKEYERDPEGRETRIRYERGNPVSTTMSGAGTSVTTSTVFDPKFNKPVSQTDGNGKTTTFTLDNRGNVTRVSLPNGRSMQLAYAALGDLQNVVDEHGLNTTFAYDDYGNPTTVAREVSRGNVVTTTKAYDARSRMTSSADTLDPSVTNTYDALDRVTRSVVTDPAGIRDAVTSNFTYSPGGQLKTENRAGGAQQLGVAYAYDHLDRLVRRTETVSGAGQFVLNYTYDGNSNLLSESDRRGVTHAYGYDALNFRISTTVSGSFGASAEVEHVTTMDKVGNPRAVVDLYGKTTTFEYDGLHRLIKRTSPGDYTDLAEYDANNNVKSSTDRNGRITTTTYDSLNRPVEQRDPAGHVTDWTYDDGALSVSTQTFPQGLTTTRQTDTLGRPLLEEFKFDDGDYKTTYVYNGRNVRVTDPRGTVTAKTISAFGEAGAVTVENASPAWSNEMSYAGFGALKSRKDALNRTTTFTCDGLGRATSVQHPGGSAETFTYDGEGNVLSHTDLRGTVIEMTYDNVGRPLMTRARNGTDQVTVSTLSYDDASSTTTMRDALNHSTVTVYDGLRRPTSVTNADGKTKTLQYDGVDLLQESDFKGQSTTYKYDQLDRVVEARDRESHFTTVIYDDRGGLTKQVNDRRGHTHVETYDPLGRLVRVTSGGETVASFEYDGNDNRTTRRDGRGFLTRYTYDALNRVKTASHENIQNETYDYDAVGNLLRYFDGAGGAVTQTFDELHHLKTRTDGAGNLTQYRFDGEGLLLEQTDPKSHKSSYSYNALGSLVGVTDAKSGAWAFEYNGDQTLKSVRDALGRTVSYSYDTVKRLKSVAQPGGVTTSYDYDENGNRTSITDPKGQTTAVTYDALDRAKTIQYGNTQGAGPRNYDYGYDPEGNITSVSETASDAAGASQTRTYARSYDSRDRLESATDPFGHRVAYSYDAADNVKSFTDASGRITRYDYNSLNRLQTAQLPGGASVGYTWRDDGMLDKVSYPAGMERRYEYDDADRLTSVKNSLGGNVTEEYDYTYDHASNRETETKKLGGVAFRQASYSYDELDRLTHVAYGAEAEKGLKGEYFDNPDFTNLKSTRTDAVVDFNWPALSSPDPSIDSESFSVRWTGQVQALYSENYTFHVRSDEGVRLWVDGQLVIDHWDAHTSTEDSGTYQLTAGHKSDIRLELREDTGDAEARLMWSSQSQPKQVIPQSQLNVPPPQPAVQTALDYSYDAVGNRLSESGTDTSGNAVNHTYTYDDLNRLKTANGYAGGDFSYSYDPNGNLIGVTQANQLTASLQYDARDQLRRVLNGTGHESGRYDYDFERRRLARTAFGVERRYVYDGADLSGEYDTAGQLVNSFDYGSDLVRSTLSGEGERWHFSDAQGSVTALSAVTGVQGNQASATARYEYGAWGEVMAGGGSANQFGYTGQRLDSESGLMALGNGERYYAPTLGRFIQQDSFEGKLAEAQTLNRYAYVRSNPLRYIDPTGHFDEESRGRIAKATKDVGLNKNGDTSAGGVILNALARSGYDAWNLISFGALSRQEENVAAWENGEIDDEQFRNRTAANAIVSFGKLGITVATAGAGSSLTVGAGLLTRVAVGGGLAMTDQFLGESLEMAGGFRKEYSSAGSYALTGTIGGVFGAATPGRGAAKFATEGKLTLRSELRGLQSEVGELGQQVKRGVSRLREFGSGFAEGYRSYKPGGTFMGGGGGGLQEGLERAGEGLRRGMSALSGEGAEAGEAGQRLLPAARSAKDLRNSPGTATGGETLPEVEGDWLRGTHGNAGRIPKQVADRLRGQSFKSFDEFRAKFWETVADTPELASQFRNVNTMREGYAPFAPQSQQLGGQMRYILHHRVPIQHGGGVYDLENLMVVTPRYHKEVLASDYHY